MTQINLRNEVVERRLAAYARIQGIDVDGVVERLLLASLPHAEETSSIDGVVDEENAESISFLEKLIAQAPTDPEEIRKADAEYRELLENLNRNRILAGEEPLFP